MTYREEHVLFVLVDSLWVRDGVSVLEDAHALTGQDGLIYLQRRRVNFSSTECQQESYRQLKGEREGRSNLISE